MKFDRVRIYWLIIVIIGFIVFWIKACVIPLYKHYNETSFSETEKKQKGEQYITKYKSLFPQKARAHLALSETQFSRNQHPLVCFTYGFKFPVIIQETNLRTNIPLEKIIHPEKKDAQQSSDIVYSGFGFTNEHLDFSSRHDSVVTGFYITYNNIISDQLVCGDSIVSYKLKGTNYSIRYEANDIFDWLGYSSNLNAPGQQASELNTSITFYKKGLSVFIIIACFSNPKKQGDETLIPGLLGVKEYSAE